LAFSTLSKKEFTLSSKAQLKEKAASLIHPVRVEAVYFFSIEIG
jgi:hypothetical protein